MYLIFPPKFRYIFGPEYVYEITTVFVYCMGKL